MPAVTPSMMAPVDDELDLSEPSLRLIKPKHSSFKERINSLNRSLVLDDSHERARGDYLVASNQAPCFTPRVSNRPHSKRVRLGGQAHIDIFSRDLNSLQNSIKDWKNLNVKESFSITRDPSPAQVTIKSVLHEEIKPQGKSPQVKKQSAPQQDFKRVKSLGQNSRLFQNANKKVLVKILKERLRFQMLSEVQANEQGEAGKSQQKGIERVTKIKYSFKTVCTKCVNILQHWNRRLVSSKWLELLVIFAVILNSIVIAIYDNADRDNVTQYNQTLDRIQFCITIFFTVEAFIKICNRGLIFHQQAYLRDPWNWVDLFTVTIGWLEIIELAPNLRFLRTFRVLKPMRSIHAIPGLRRLINSLLKSLTMFLNIVAFLVFFLNFFSIVGVSMFKGMEYNRCHFDLPEGGQNGSQQLQQWKIDQGQHRLCSKDVGAGYQCAVGTFCGNPTDSDELYKSQFNGTNSLIYQDKVIMYGMWSFNNVVLALSTIFQALTLEGWIFNMYNMQDAGSDYWSPIYFLLIVVFGAFFLINLILAGIMDSFYKVDREIAVDEMKKEFRDVESKAQETLKKKLKIKKAIRRLMTMGDAQERSVKPSLEVFQNFESQNQEGRGDASGSPDHVNDPRIRVDDQLVDDSLVESLLTESIEFTGMDEEEGGGNVLQRKITQDQGGFSDDLIQEKNVEKLQNVLKEGSDSQKLKIQVNEPRAPQVNIEEKIIQRSKKNRVYRFFYQVTMSKTLSVLIMFSILINTVVIFSDQHPISSEQLANFELMNKIFYFIFVGEVLIKILGLGVINYLRDSYNIFDTLIIIFSTIEIALANADSAESNQLIRRVLIIFRPFRMLRIFKLARKWSSLNFVLVKMLNSFKEVGNFLVLLALFLFIYALLGMELYANNVKFDANEMPVKCESYQYCLENGKSPRINFDGLGDALLGVFVIVIGDDWNSIMAQFVRATNLWSIFYFISLTIMGNIVLLNLLLAILLREFEDESGLLLTSPEQNLPSFNLQERLSQFWARVRNCSRRIVEGIKECLGVETEEGREVAGQKRLNKEATNVPVEKRKTGGSMTLGGKFDPIDVSPHKEQVTDVNNPLHQNCVQFRNHKQDRSLTFRQSIQSPELSHMAEERKEIGINLPPFLLEDGNDELEIKGKSEELLVDQDIFNDSQRILIKKAEESPATQSQALPQKFNSDSINIKPKMVQVIDIFRNVVFQKKEEGLYLSGNSLNLFGPKNKFRKFCYIIGESNIVQVLVLLMIVLQTVTLAIADPLSDPNSNFNKILFKIDAAISAAFILESVFKIIARGFLFNGQYSYLKSGWNQLDFSVVILSILSLLSVDTISSTKVLRNLRVVRPLRMITKNKGLKISLQSLANSLKSLLNISIITLFSYFVWGIFGVNFFKGLYFYCHSKHQSGDPWTQMLYEIRTKWECHNSGGEWIKHKNNFDNVLIATMSLYQIATTEGWYELMLKSVDGTEVDVVPKENSNTPATLYFVAFIFIGGQFILNIFQGIVISTYLKEKERLTNNQNLTEMQREWVIAQIKVYRSKPHLAYSKNVYWIRRKMFEITSSDIFDKFVFALICLNTLILALNWLLIDPKLEDILDTINHVFTAIFTLEAIMKIVGHGRLYFKKHWNLFDFFIVVFTFVQIIYSSQVLGEGVTLHATVVRVLKFMRALRIVKKAEMLKKIAMTLILTVPSLANIAFLLFLLMIFYAIVGMNLFGRVMLHDALDEHANFQSFPKAFLTMMRCATGEGWNEIMNALMDQYSIVFQCDDRPSYEDIMASQGRAVACGSYWASLTFFISYILLVSQIFLNLFVAIILDGFDDSKQQSEVRITDEMVSRFQVIWSEFDSEATGYILAQDIEEFVRQLILKKTRWIRGGAALLNSPRRKLLTDFITLLELPLYKNCTCFCFYDVLSRLTQIIFKVDFEKFIQTHYYMRDQDHVRLDATNAQGEDNIAAQASVNRSELDPFSEMGDGMDDGMSWMNARDMLIFESFEDFYSDLVVKLNSFSAEQVLGINEDLQLIQKLRESKLLPVRDKFDSRVLAAVPRITHQMRKLIARMRERRSVLGEERARSEAQEEIVEIRQHIKRQNTSMHKMTDMLIAIKKRENLFQILAKTVEVDMQEQDELVMNQMMEQQKKEIYATLQRGKTTDVRSGAGGLGDFSDHITKLSPQKIGPRKTHTMEEGITPIPCKEEQQRDTLQIPSKQKKPGKRTSFNRF